MVKHNVYNVFNYRLSCISEHGNYIEGQTNNVMFQICYSESYFVDHLIIQIFLGTDRRKFSSDCEGK